MKLALLIVPLRVILILMEYNDQFQLVEQIGKPLSRIDPGEGFSFCVGSAWMYTDCSLPSIRSSNARMPLEKRSVDINVAHEGPPSRMRSVL